jgi:hypothetical protein
MSRTWEQNRDTINGLWPMAVWTPEEADLWRADLSGLDHDVLFDALREVKRSRESIYPQLAWVHAAYREVMAARRATRRAAERGAGAGAPAYSTPRMRPDPARERRARVELETLLEQTEPAGLEAVRRRAGELIDAVDALWAARFLARVAAKAAGDRAAACVVVDAVDVRGPTDDAAIEARRAQALRVLAKSS